MSHRPRPAAVLVTLLLALGLLVAVPGSAQAAGCTVTWKGQATGDWGDVANWTPAVVPGSTGREGDQVCVTSGNTVLLTTIGGGNYTVASINGSAADGPTLEFRGGTSLSVVGGPGIGATALGGIRILGNSLRIASGATVNATRLDIGNDGATPPSVGRLDGYGTLNVAGPIAVKDGGAIYNTDIDNGDASKLVINQTLAGATFVVDGRGTPAGRYTQMYGPKLTTSSDISVLGPTYWANDDMRTTGQLVLSAGASINGGGRATARGITVPAGATAKVDVRLILTGATSSLGADLNLCDTQICGGGLELTSTGRLTIPAGRTVDDHGWARDTTLAGQITGAGTLRMYNGLPRVTSGAVLSVGRLEVRGGRLTLDAGSTATLGSLYAAGNNIVVGTALAVGSGGLTLDGGGGFAGDGTVTVAGPVLMKAGAYTSAPALHLAQTGTHAFALTAPGGNLVLDAQTTTPNDVTLDGDLGAGGTFTTTGRFVLATNAVVSGYGGVVARGFGFGSGSRTNNISITGSTTTFAGDARANLVEVASGATLSVPSGRTFTVNEFDNRALTVRAGGTLTGFGTVVNAVRNEGTVLPGGAGVAGTLTVGRYTQTATGVLRVNAGSAAASRLRTAQATLEGSVAVARIGGWAPAAGTKLTVLSGTSAPSVAGSVTVSDTAVTGKFATPTVTGNDVVLTATAASAVAPGAPGLRTAGGVRSIVATVSAPASPGTKPITSYRITCSPSCGTQVLRGPGRVSITGLSNGTWYTVRAVALSAVGTGAATSVRVRTTVPAAVAVVPATVVLGRSNKVTVTCKATTAKIRDCSVSARVGRTAFAATKKVTVRKAAGSITVTLTLTKAGKRLLAEKGSARVTITASVRPATGSRSLGTTRTVLVRRA